MLRSFLRLLGFDQRTLFRFFDGMRWRCVDPITVTRRLFCATEFDWDATPQLLRTCGHALMELEALRIISTAVRDAFELQPVSAGGLSELECWHLFCDLSAWLGNVKKNGSLFPTWQNATGSTPSPPTDIFPTKPGQDFGSISTEPSLEQPLLPAERIATASAKG